MNVIDRFAMSVSPTWALRRLTARARLNLVRRHFDAATAGRRGEGWGRGNADANATLRRLETLRARSRHLARNNPTATRMISVLSANIVGWGIQARPQASNERRTDVLKATWKDWAETPACDVMERCDLNALQDQIVRTVAESGDCLVRQVRLPRATDNNPVPLQLQLLEPDHLDANLTGTKHAQGDNVIIQGVEVNRFGKPVAYWLFDEHPGAEVPFGKRNLTSRRVPAEEVVSVFDILRIGQLRGVPWLVPAMLEIRDYGDWRDARLMAAKIASCFSAFIRDELGGELAIGQQKDLDELTTHLEPGAIQELGPGQEVQFATPPPLNGSDDFSREILAIAAGGVGVTYEQVSGDYSRVNFSSARMARLEFTRLLHRWQWHMMIGLGLNRIGQWFSQAAQFSGVIDERARFDWTPPALEPIDPEKEARGDRDQVRGGFATLSHVVRAKGYDPDQHFQEMADDAKRLDALGLVLDSDPRKTSAAGLTQARTEGSSLPGPSAYQDEEGDHSSDDE